jgi:hypothetical protein
MEDEARPLPPGWTRCYDTHYSHQYFVDTNASPPRSIWHHPYDDEQFLASLSAAERDQLKQKGLLGPGGDHDLAAEYESTDDEVGGRSGDTHPESAGSGRKGKLARLEDKFKNKQLERQARRDRERQQEDEAHAAYKHFRKTLEEAVRSGRPAIMGIDKQGREVYLQPPGAVYHGVSGYHNVSEGLTEVLYSPGGGPGIGAPGSRFVKADGVYGYAGGGGGGGAFPGTLGYGTVGGYGRPPYPYARPLGRGYGGGFGLPLMMPLMGGFMLGSMMF